MADILGFEEITVLEGTHDVQLTCPYFKDHNKAAKYSWYVNGSCLEKDPSKYQTGKSGQLTFFTIARNDTGEYMCRLSDESVAENYTFYIHVDYPPMILQLHEPLQIVEKGSNVYLDCEVDGKPFPTVQWLKDGQQLLTNGRYLLLYYVSSMDLGKYQCIASNKYGSVQSSSMEVTFHVPIYFTTLLPDKIDVESHGNVTLECKAEGKPKPVIEWYRFDERLNSSETVQINDTVLKIRDVTINEMGTYSCMAWNSYGETHEQSVYVSMKNIPEVVNVTLRYVDRSTVVIDLHLGNNDGYPIKYIQLEYRQLYSNNPDWIILPTIQCEKEKQTSYTIRNLDWTGHYQLNIQAVNDISKSPTTTINFAMSPKMKSRVVRQINPTPSEIPSPSNLSKVGYIFFITVGVLIAFSMLLFICIVMVCFCQQFCQRLRTGSVFDDEIYVGPGIENPNLTTESYELMEVDFNAIQRQGSEEQLIPAGQIIR
ncbi:contactin-1-like isoform X2 [Ptychodera flava]|uniref:contactin-1-like isoform X2 n=1 Tax=Ptychodera flava TaxID=63121 RepID=UPI00396A21E9